ncbi:MAG: 16S rRNA (guanine(527)-N(7))-methyltransferase RsmG [Rhodospirillales bacterium]|nr:16S rRNA (guanine(527)-N(7))-methyltransferase RsmG [Rhodospirillales bacterium]MSP80749.1 16S rRNA (guanine(527)-N(7))-methyltransferase RsmG [Rhodospirillales bacterium]
MTAEDFAHATSASPETMKRLKRFVALLEKWQSVKNLVGKSTLPDVWHRHILDSAQLEPLVAKVPGSMADIGSGAGFPGLVLAIMTGRHVHLIESDTGKCAFMAEVARATDAPVTILNRRIESVTDIKFAVVTARAVARLVELIGLAEPIMEPDSRCFFLKGQRVSDELTKALKRWNMIVTRIPSVTDEDAAILKLEMIARKP